MSHSSSHAVPIPRPPIVTTSSGSFRTRSLAVSASQRLHHPPGRRGSGVGGAGSPRSISSETSTIQGNLEGDNGVHGYGTSSDIEAAHPPRNHQSVISPNSSNSPLSPISGRSARSGGMRHRKHKNRHKKHIGEEYRWMSTTAQGGGTGDEPGVDVKSKRDEEAYGHLKSKTKITVVDYSSNPDEDNTNLRCEFPGERLREWLDSDHGARRIGEDGKPTGVRWIHIDGLNWQVIKTLVLQFGLHPLAVEDALRATNTPRSKLDFYRNHLYLQILIHHTTPSDEIRLSMAAQQMASEREAGFATDDDSASIIGGGDNASIIDGQQTPDTTTTKKGIRARLSGLFGLSSSDDYDDGPGGNGRRDSVPRLPEGVEGVFEPSLVTPRHAGGHHTFEKQAHTLTVNELSAKYMVPIRRGILSLFMLRDGTLITMDAKPTREVLAPIYHRLEDESSLLRRSGDVSMLAQAILDVAADLAIEISQTFESELLKLEASVLVNPQMETVRHLHILSSQLIRLRRSLTPLLHLCYIVRDQDTQRSVAASAMVPTGTRSGGNSANGYGGNGNNGMPHHSGGVTQHTHLGLSLMPPSSSSGGYTGQPPPPLSPTPSRSATPLPGSLGRSRDRERSTEGVGADDTASVLSMFGMPNNSNQPVHIGFFSPMTKVYIGDVIDHLEITVGSLEQFVNTCDHLTDYVFNVLSFNTNESTERLSIVTVVFLPLTFIASYYGMNFDEFGDLHGSVSYFWKVAVPCTVGFFVLFAFGYLKAFSETLSRKVRRWRWMMLLGGRGNKRVMGRGVGGGIKRNQ